MPTLAQMIVWALFGLIVGLIAKGLMPGRDPGGLIFTSLLGIAGALLGNYAYFLVTGAERHPEETFTFTGALLAVGGALVLLGAYRVIFGRPRG